MMLNYCWRSYSGTMPVLKYGRRLCLNSGCYRYLHDPARSLSGSHYPPQSSSAKSHPCRTWQQSLVVQWQRNSFSMSYFLPLSAVSLNTMRLHHTVMWMSLSHRYLHDSAPLRGIPRRILPHGRVRKTSKKKVKDKRVVLIDLDGTNLGEMDGEMDRERNGYLDE